MKASLVTCAKLHKTTFISTFTNHLPRIKDLGQLKLDEQVFTKLEENMQEREKYARELLRITSNEMDNHVMRLA